MRFGPAHIVWEDENFSREHVQWCLEHFGEYADGIELSALAEVRQSLEEMLELPDDILCSEPDDYDGMNPEAYPPKTPHRIANAFF